MRIGLEPHALTKSCALVQQAAEGLQDDELREYILSTLDKNHEPFFRFVQNYAIPEAKRGDVHTIPRLSSITLGQADERMGGSRETFRWAENGYPGLPQRRL